MDIVTKNLYHLLYLYDYVTIPGLGTFVANYRSAYINPVNQSLYPPSKKIIFNRKLKENDGLLVDFISKQENITYESALNIINSFSNKILNSSKYVIDNIGTFYFDANKNLCFEQNENVNFLLESYASFPIKLSSSHISKNKAKIVNKKSIFKEKYKYAAVISLLIVSILVFLLLPDIHKPAFLDFASLSIFENSNTNKSLYNKRISKELIKTLPQIKNNGESKIVEIRKNYLVVAGCFRIKNNAKRFVEKTKRKGFNSKIAGKRNGLYVVVLEAFAKKKEAKNFINEVKKNHKLRAWVLKINGLDKVF